MGAPNGHEVTPPQSESSPGSRPTELNPLTPSRESAESVGPGTRNKLMTTDARYDKEVLIARHLERLDAAQGAPA